MDYNYNGINNKELRAKLQEALHNTIRDLPFGNCISEDYRKALETVVYYIMYYNKDSVVATIPMITGGGKSTALINATSYMVSDKKLFPYSGTVILKLEQKDCDETANAINGKVGREVAYAYHSGIGKNNKPKSRISKKKLSDYPILVMCHEGFKELVKNDDYNRILNWTDGKVNPNYSDFNKFQRRRVVIDEEISNIEIQTITLKTIALIENSIMNMGNRYLYNVFNDFISQIRNVFIKPYEIKANSSIFIHLDIKVPEKLDEYIYKECDRSTQQAYLTLRNFIKNGGYIQHANEIEKKTITTYAHINLNIPMLYKVQLDATAKINYLYNINNDFSIVKLPDFKTYTNTYIHVFDKITGSRSTIEQGFNKGLLESCIRDIKNKATAGDKVLIILNNKGFIDKFKETFYNSKLFDSCKEFTVDFTYYGAFAGKNKWSSYNKLFMIGIPIYSETTYPILYHVNSGNSDLDKFDTTLIPMDGARRYLQQEFEKVRVSIIAREMIQGINRIRCRLFDDGDTPETHIYTINKDKEIDYIIKKAMPEVNILYDWDLDYKHEYSNTEKEPTKEEVLISEITKIQDNPVYRELIVAKGLINDKGIKKSDLRSMCYIDNRQTFSRIFNSPLFEQFCKDRNIDISNKKSHYINI